MSSSLSSSSRAGFYSLVETFMEELTGMNGQSCLLRAMCEAKAEPVHEEGIFGDIVDFFLTLDHTHEEDDLKFKKYSEAQSKGQVIGVQRQMYIF